MYVKCGKCKACLQEKANLRTKRIRATEKDGYVCLMVALTYRRFNAPYILRDDAYKFAKGEISRINVYRDVKWRKVRKPKPNDDYFQSYKVKRGRHVIDTIDFIKPTTLKGTKDMKHEFERIGVCHYPDMQGFVARLRLNLNRHFDYENQLFIYACSEYGCKSFRPHFHLLIFCPKADAEIVKSAIYESWPFSNLRQFDRAVEFAFRASTYVASYVNSGSKFPSFFKTYAKQKHSYSKGFGCNNRKFTLDSLLSMLERGSFRYSVQKVIQGVTKSVNVPLPSYVVHRFFPKFKGYTRIPPTEMVAYMHRFAKFENPYVDVLPFPKPRKTFVLGDMQESPALYWTDDEIHKIGVCLNNAYHRFCDNYPDRDNIPSLDDYFVMHKKVWSCFNATLLRFQMENELVPLVEKYDNLDYFVTDDVKRQNDFFYTQGAKILFAQGIDPALIRTTNPNKFDSTIRITAEHSQWFDDHIKHKNVSNEIYLQSEDCEL